MKKFKPGDRVVVIKHVPYASNGHVYDIKGWKGRVEEYDFAVIGRVSIILDGYGRLPRISDASLEHEHIYNSPLYKALS